MVDEISSFLKKLKFIMYVSGLLVAVSVAVITFVMRLTENQVKANTDIEIKKIERSITERDLELDEERKALFDQLEIIRKTLIKHDSDNYNSN